MPLFSLAKKQQKVQLGLGMFGVCDRAGDPEIEKKTHVIERVNSPHVNYVLRQPHTNLNSDGGRALPLQLQCWLQYHNDLFGRFHRLVPKKQDSLRPAPYE